jgi:hypothetical protein
MSGNVIARLTVNRANGNKLIVEVHSDATFNQFYRYFKQVGNRRSTKEQIRVTSRNDGLKPINAHLQTPGLEAISNQIIASSAVFLLRSENGTINPVVSIKLRILKKRAYRKLITARPDDLGMTRLTTTDMNKPRAIPVTIPTFRIVAKANRRKLHHGLVK